MTKNKEIVVAETKALATKNVARGFEGDVDDSSDIIIPRAKLIQPMSPEILEGLEGIKLGCLINSITKQVLPQEFIPIFRYKEYIKFNPRNKDEDAFDPSYEPNALIWKTTDPNDPRTAECKFGPNGEKPTALEVLNFFSIFPGQDMPIIVSFMKTSYKTGKQLLSVAKMLNCDMFKKKYKLYSEKVKGDQGEYFILKFQIVGDSSEGEYAICEDLWNNFNLATIKTHDEEMSA